MQHFVMHCVDRKKDDDEHNDCCHLDDAMVTKMVKFHGPNNNASQGALIGTDDLLQRLFLAHAMAMTILSPMCHGSQDFRSLSSPKPPTCLSFWGKHGETL